jgi:hypothetical protein
LTAPDSSAVPLATATKSESWWKDRGIRRKLLILGALTLLTLATLLMLRHHRPIQQVALLFPASTTVLVLFAMFTRDPKDEDIAAFPGIVGLRKIENPEPWKTFYDKTVQWHIDTDKGMYQLITVFVGASLLVLGWAVGGSRKDPITADEIAVLGSLAVVLVGLATLLKHRLRYYNKLREIYLRALEMRFCGADRTESGPQGFMKKMAATTPVHWTSKIAPNFHEAIDLYYFVHALLWFVVYKSKA